MDKPSAPTTTTMNSRLPAPGPPSLARKLRFYTVFGERCSGTNYVEHLMRLNFPELAVTWSFGHKHFFHPRSVRPASTADGATVQNTLFVCIVRDVEDWMHSLFRERHHLPIKYLALSEADAKERFLHHEWMSFQDIGTDHRNDFDAHEILDDRHMHTGQRYRNVFELRHVKLEFLRDLMPTLVPHTAFVRYEDLVADFARTMRAVRQASRGATVAPEFPINTHVYKDLVDATFDIRDVRQIRALEYRPISRTDIVADPQFVRTHELALGYIRLCEATTRVVHTVVAVQDELVVDPEPTKDSDSDPDPGQPEDADQPREDPGQAVPAPPLLRRTTTTTTTTTILVPEPPAEFVRALAVASFPASAAIAPPKKPAAPRGLFTFPHSVAAPRHKLGKYTNHRL